MTGRKRTTSPLDSDKKEFRICIIGQNHSVEKMFRDFKSPFMEFRVVDEYDNPNLICFIGGPDVNPALYGEERLRMTSFQEYRDNLDLELYNKFTHLPKIGICRGGQFLNVLSGGSMWQDVDNHTKTHDLVNLLSMPGRQFPGDRIQVSSTHHQMMIPSNKGVVLAIAVDDTERQGIAKRYVSAKKERPRPSYDTEALWYEGTQSLCFQPHPEFAWADLTSKYFFNLIKFFFVDHNKYN